jgi:hypothetical protein
MLGSASAGILLQSFSNTARSDGHERLKIESTDDAPTAFLLLNALDYL